MGKYNVWSPGIVSQLKLSWTSCQVITLPVLSPAMQRQRASRQCYYGAVVDLAASRCLPTPRGEVIQYVQYRHFIATAGSLAASFFRLLHRPPMSKRTISWPKEKTPCTTS